MHVDLPQKLYYSIGEVSKAFNVNASLILLTIMSIMLNGE